MARHAKFSNDDVIDAAARLAARSGPAQVTIGAIASELSAPTGSIYHRFTSRDQLLGEVWLRTAANFQTQFAARLFAGAPRQAGLSAALLVPAFVRAEPIHARILLLHRREDFLHGAWPEAIAQRAQALKSDMDTGLRRFTRSALDRSDSAALRLVKFALIDAPLAAVLPHLRSDEPPPPLVDGLIEIAFCATLDAAEKLLPRRKSS